jgi:hypothetical protein
MLISSAVRFGPTVRFYDSVLRFGSTVRFYGSVLLLGSCDAGFTASRIALTSASAVTCLLITRSS